MFCSSCGSPVSSGLSFCNRCGVELNKKPGASAPTIRESLVWSIVAVSVGGLALIIGLMAVMKNELHFDNQLIVLVTLLSFLLLLLAEIVFIWMLVKSSRKAKPQEQIAGQVSELPGITTKELGEARERFLNEPALSVTEQTTRTLEAVRTERRDL